MCRYREGFLLAVAASPEMRQQHGHFLSLYEWVQAIGKAGVKSMSSATHQCTYAFAKLSMRDALVFKSIVGLLNGRTSVQWQHAQEQSPDLLVLGCAENEPLETAFTPSVTLHIAVKDQPQDALCVHWPLRAPEVFERLEQAAKQVMQSTQSLPDTLGCSYKLLGWPSHSLLAGDAGYLRMTTLLAARAMTLQELSERSQQDLARCTQCIALLEANGLLQVQQHEVAAQPAPSTAPGFFARLRAHLGLAAS